MHPDDTDQRVCHETIYAAIYAHPRGGPEEITLLFGVKTRLALDFGTGPVVHGGRGGRSRCGDVLAVAIKKRRCTASLPRIEGCLIRAATLLRVRNFSRRNHIGYSRLRPQLIRHHRRDVDERKDRGDHEYRSDYGTHTMRRTKATLIYKRTKNLRAVQLLLGHTKIESTIRYLGIEVDDALEMSEQTEI